MDHGELVIDARTGEVRQAGADGPGAWARAVREACEGSLYLFAKIVLGRTYFTRLHREICDFVQWPGGRRLVLAPREHGKTSIVAHCLPIHILIQPKERNLYFPGEDGAEQRILLASATLELACDGLGVIRSLLDGCALLRAWWPHRVWFDRPRTTKWNETSLSIPRTGSWPDPSVRAIGVGGEVTGRHPSALIEDDLVGREAANSPAMMDDAMDWHIAAGALVNSPKNLVRTIGTRWGVADIYGRQGRGIIHEQGVRTMRRAIVEDGVCIWPERFTMDPEGEPDDTGEPTKRSVDYLMRRFGTLFPLLYMNSEADPELVDFDMAEVREFRIEDGRIVFDEDERDLGLRKRREKRAGRVDAVRARVE